MKSKEVEAMAMQLLPKLPGFRVKGRLMFAQPVQHVLRAIYFDASSSADAFYVWVFFLPLYVPQEDLSFNLGKRLRPAGWNRNEPGMLDKLTRSIETEAVPFLNSVSTLEQVLLTLDVRAATSIDSHTWEALAYTHILLGQI